MFPWTDVLPKDLRREMLDLTGDIAHNVVRVAVPWTSYLMGVAVGRGAFARGGSADRARAAAAGPFGRAVTQ